MSRTQEQILNELSTNIGFMKKLAIENDELFTELMEAAQEAAQKQAMQEGEKPEVPGMSRCEKCDRSFFDVKKTGVCTKCKK